MVPPPWQSGPLDALARLAVPYSLPGNLQPRGIPARGHAERFAVFAAELRGALVADQIADLRDIRRLGHEQGTRFLQPDLLLELDRCHRRRGAEVPVKG